MFIVIYISIHVFKILHIICKTSGKRLAAENQNSLIKFGSDLTMDFDNVLEELGEMGRFQITTYILVCLPVLFAAANSMTYVFVAGVPNYRCLIPECDTSDDLIYNTSWLQYAIPDESSDNIYKAAQCSRYVTNFTANNESCSEDLFTTTVQSCREWVFDHDERTIVNDWNITCLENQWMLSLVATSNFVGKILGSAIFGVLADRYGRKSIFIFCTVLMSISGIIKIYSPDYITFTTFVFINSFGTGGVYPLAFVIGVELVGRKKREVTGMILNYFYAIGEAMLALIAWFTRDWILLQLSVSAPAILFVVYYWYVPESVRWLLVKERNIEARKIICKVAEINKVTLSQSLLDSFKQKDKNTKRSQDIHEEMKMVSVLKRMVKSKKLIIRFVILLYIWSVNAFVYYGLSLYSTSMGGNKYLNFALVCLVEIPGYSISWVSIQKFGRRPSLIVFLLVCGLTCSAAICVPSNVQWAATVLFLIGKLGVTAAFGVIYVHTSEMLPTVIRSGGVGVASTIGRVGALLAPFIPLLGVYVQSLPMLLFGGVAIFAGLLAFKLPETLGIKLPESVEDAERL